MTTRKLTRFSSLAACLTLVLSTVLSTVTFAAGSTIFVTPNTGSLQVGQSITVQVKGNISTGTTFGADTVSGSLQFPSNRLKVTNVSTAGATFNWQVSATPTASSVNFDERTFSFSPINDSSVHIMSVTFQALTAGSASLSFSSNTRFSYSSFGTNYPTTLSGGTYTVNSPPPTSCPSGQIGTPPNCTTPPPATCPTGQVGTPPNCTTPTPAKCPSGQTGTPPNCKTPTPSTGGSSGSGNKTPTTPAPTPVVQSPTEPIPEPTENGLSISDTSTTRSYSSASLNWKTSSPAKNKVTYGTSLRQLDKTAEVTQEGDGTYTAKLVGLTPGKRYYFTVNAESEKDATKTSTYSGVFTTKGFPVAVAITEGGSAASNAKIKISEQNYSTDKSGKIAFELASGSYTVEVTTSKSSKKFTLAVAEKTIPDTNKAPDTQNFTFDIPVEAAASGGLSPLSLVGIGVGAIATLGILGGLFLFWRRRKAQAEASSSVDTDYTWSAQQPLPAFPQEQMQPTAPTPIESMPMDAQYAAPPNMLPPQEIMPPDQAVAMAVQELPPTPADIPPEADSMPDPIAMEPVATTDPSQQMVNEQPVYNMPPLDEGAVGTETPQLEEPSATATNPQPDAYTPPTTTVPETELVEPETTPGEIENPEPFDQAGQTAPEELTPHSPTESSDIDDISGEPGLTDAPPTTENGKGELQIDHHPDSEIENSVEASEEAPGTETLDTQKQTTSTI